MGMVEELINILNDKYRCTSDNFLLSRYFIITKVPKHNKLRRHIVARGILNRDSGDRSSVRWIFQFVELRSSGHFQVYPTGASHHIMDDLTGTIRSYLLIGKCTKPGYQYQ